jgi:hypothetical protein
MEERNKCLTLKVRVESYSENINAVCSPAGCCDDNAFEIDRY